MPTVTETHKKSIMYVYFRMYTYGWEGKIYVYIRMIEVKRHRTTVTIRYVFDDYLIM